MSPLSIIFRSRLKEIKNYCQRRLDRITLLEFFIALIVFLLLFHQSIENELRSLQADPKAAYPFYTALNLLFWAGLTVTGAYYGFKKSSDRHIFFLMTLPLKITIIARLKAVERLLQLAIVLPFWLYWQIRFHLFFADYGLLPFILLWQIGFTAAIWMCGWSSGFILRNWREQTALCIIGLPLCISMLVGLAVCMSIQRPWHLIGGAILALVLAVSGFRIYQAAVQTRLVLHPHTFFNSSAGSRSKTVLYRWVRLFTLPAPAHLRPMLIKDMLYAGRRYRGYGLWMLAAVGAMATSWIAPANAAVSLDWQLAIFIGSAFLLSNMTFKFNAVPAENWALLKSLPLPARRFWWSKFFLVFLPSMWLWLISVGVFIAYPGGAPLVWLRGIFFSLLIITSLLFIQNNFSLYSYPFSQWAQIWYNLYIATLILFFTILLFPPLALLFVFYGFYATGRVQRRFNQWEPTL